MQILLSPFVWILQLFYNLFNNYGLALILFALLVKVIMFPLSLKGKRSMIKMNMLNDKTQKLQKMYGKNQERYQQELQKLYEKEHVNPMGGCLWSLLPVLVIFPLYAIIRQPLTYMMGVAPEVMEKIAQLLNWDTVAVANGWINQSVVDAAVKAASDAGTAFVTSFQSTGYQQLYLSSLITPENLSAVRAVAGESVFALNFGFLGIDLSAVPNLMFWANGLTWGAIGLFLLPVLSAVSGLVFSKVSMSTNAVNQQSQQAANNKTSKMMLIISPLLSLWIGFSMPAALSVYWIANSLFSMVQEYIAGKMLKSDYEKAREAQALREQEEEEEAKRLKEEARAERIRRLEEEKKAAKGKKKPAAKKKDDAAANAVKEASRVGLRTYARGRAYDPYRFSPDGPTPYGEKVQVDDDAVEKALEEKARAKEEAEFSEKYQLTEEELAEVEKAAEAQVAAQETDGGEDTVRETEETPDSGETAEPADDGDEPAEL